jgi:hypothetical protein
VIFWFLNSGNWFREFPNGNVNAIPHNCGARSNK